VTVGRDPVVRARALLAVAILLEVVGTLSLRASDGFTHPGWTLLVVGGYVTSVVVFGRVLALGMTLGVAYGTLTAVGLVAAALTTALVYRESLDPLTGVGLLLLLGGVILLQRRPPSSAGAA